MFCFLFFMLQFFFHLFKKKQNIKGKNFMLRTHLIFQFNRLKEFLDQKAKLL